MRYYSAILLVLFVAFFILEVSYQNEIFLTIVMALISLALFVKYEKGEIYLYIIGLFGGLFIEVGLGQVNRLQHWENASFFGVPYWLPLVWGFGFVLIRRVGNSVVGFFGARGKR